MRELSLMEVRTACAHVADRAESVQVRRGRLSSYAAELAASGPSELALDPHCHYLGHGDDTVAFVLTLDAINFGSGWFPWLVDRGGAGGYFTIAAALSERFTSRGPLTATELAEIQPAACAEILGQTEAPAEIDGLMAHFADAWRDLGRYLETRFEGSFTGLVEEAVASAERLVSLLAEMPAFDDVAEYGETGLRVPFYKRAQLTVADLHLAFGGRGPGRFDDLSRLTVFADNQVPHVLRIDGLLAFEDDLARRIEGGEEIGAGTREEIEIRAATVHAVELLSTELAAGGRGTLPWELDQLLWNRGLGPRYGERPPHRTRTVFY